MRLPALTCLALLASTLLAPLASAVPITLRARTGLEVRATREPSGLALRGVLKDDLGRPVASEAVHLEVGGFEVRTVVTEADGGFELSLRPDDLEAAERRLGGRLAFTARYEGDARHGAATAGGHLDLRRDATWLELRVDPPAVSIDAERLMVHVGLRGPDGPVTSAPVRVQVADGPELLGDTDDDGNARFLIRPALLGDAGRYALRARFTGDHRYAAAEAKASFRIQLPTRVTLRVGREGDAATGRYRFSGRLIDGDGPVANATIAVLARRGAPDADPTAGGPPGPPDPAEDERPALFTTTDADGIYLSAIDARDLFEATQVGDGALEVRAVYRPSDVLHVPSASRAIVIPVPAPPGVPARWYLAGLLWVAGAMVAAHVVRHRSWRALRLRFRLRRRGPAQAEAVPEVVDPPFVLGPTASASARTDVVSGQVLDAHTRAPVAGLEVRFVASDGTTLTALTDVAGRFLVGPAAPGSWRLDVLGEAYLPRHLVTGMPHSGSLDGATFAVVAIRRRVRDLYARALAGVEGRLRWGHDTPAEALSAALLAARTDDPRVGEALAHLERLTAEAWYAPATPPPAAAEDAARLAAAVSPGAERQTGSPGGLA